MSKGFEPGSAEQNPNEKCQRDLLGAQARTMAVAIALKHSIQESNAKELARTVCMADK